MSIFYHISEDGMPRECKAMEHGNVCPLGADIQHHYTSDSDARAAFEKQMETVLFGLSMNSQVLRLRQKKDKTNEDYQELGSIIDDNIRGDHWQKSEQFAFLLGTLTKTGGKLQNPMYGRLRNKLQNTIKPFPDSVKHLDDTPFMVDYKKDRNDTRGWFKNTDRVEIPKLARKKIISEFFRKDYQVGESDTGNFWSRAELLGNSSAAARITTRVSEGEQQDFWLGEKMRRMSEKLRKISDSADITLPGGETVHVDKPLYEISSPETTLAHHITAWGMKSDLDSTGVLSHEFAHYVMANKPDIARAATAMYQSCKKDKLSEQSFAKEGHVSYDGFPGEYMSTNQDEFFAEATSQLFYSTGSSEEIYNDDAENAQKIRQWIMGVWASQ